MAATAPKPELIVIVGPTASGKSELAMKIAKKFNGEIIAADSRTIYKGMDIGTAKPSAKEQKQVPHWGLDLIEPGKPFSAYKFKECAEKAIKNIRKRGKLPILVGGSGLYVDAVLFDFGFVPAADPKQRAKLDKLSVGQLQEAINKKGYPMPVNMQNRRHLIRTIERKGKLGTSAVPDRKILIIGLLPGNDAIRDRIKSRTMGYFRCGLIDEARGIAKKYGEGVLANSGGIAYKIAALVLNKEITQAEAKELIRKGEWQYARRQKTWFRRNKFIHWFDNISEAFISVSKTLNK